MMTANKQAFALFLLGILTSLPGYNAADATNNRQLLRGGTAVNDRELLSIPQNNECSSAQNIIIPSGNIAGTTNGATISQDLLGTSASTNGPAVWYRFVGTGEEFVITLDCGNTAWNAGVKVLSSDGCLTYANDYFGRGEMCLEGVHLSIQTELNKEYHMIVSGQDDPSQGLPITGDFSLTVAIPTEAPTSSPSANPSAAPTTTPMRRKVKLQTYFGNGIGEASYLTPVRDNLNRVICSAFIANNPILETTTDENDSYSEFWLNPDGTLESVECTCTACSEGGLVVTVDRAILTTHTGVRQPQTDSEACESGVIRLANKAGNTYYIPQTGETLNLGRSNESQQTWQVREQREPSYYNDYTGTHVLESTLCANQGLSHKIVEDNGGLIKAFDQPAGLEPIGSEPHGSASTPGTEWRIIYLD